jgi:hypothetical protein
MIVLLAFAAMLSAGAEKPSRVDFTPFLHAWEGESKCTIPTSPCHDEHVIYETKLAENKMLISMYKVVKGEKLYMGDLECATRKGDAISCTIPGRRANEWVFTLTGSTLEGTLYVDEERTVYRKIQVAKKQSQSDQRLPRFAASSTTLVRRFARDPADW